MHQLLGVRDLSHPDYVCLLKKSLYDIKQAPRAWYKRFANYVSRLGFSHSKADHSLFIYCQGNAMAYILLYVDDVILIASSDALRTFIMTVLGSEFAMKDLGPLSYCLGIAITHHARSVFLSQRKYVEEIINRDSMSKCTTSVDTKHKLSANTSTPYANPLYYQSLAGVLQDLTFTRPDISYAM